MKASRLALALVGAQALLAACSGGEPAVPPATPTVAPIPATPAPTPIPFAYNPDYPIYKIPQSDSDLLGPDRIAQIRQVHRLLSEPLQRRLDAWGATFRAARTIDDLLKLPEYAGVSLPGGGAYFGGTRGDKRTYGAITNLPRGESFQSWYGHELGHVIYGLLNEKGITEDAKYYLRTTVGTGKLCPTREVKDIETLVARWKANPQMPVNLTDYGNITAEELTEAEVGYTKCRDYLSELGAIGVDSQYTGGISLDLTPLISSSSNQIVSIPLNQSNNTPTTLYAPSLLAPWNPDEFFAEGVTIYLGARLGADYALTGESYSPIENLRNYNPDFYAFIEGLLTNPDVASRFFLSEQELLKIRYGLR